MKKRYFVMMALSLSLLLGGCGPLSEPVEFYVKSDSGVTAWGIDGSESQPAVNVTVVDATEKVELPEVELEIDILGLYEVLESGEVSQNASSILVAEKEYEVWARIMLASDAEGILGQELDFLLRCPTVVEVDKKSNFVVQVLTNGGVLDGREFAVTTTAHDLRLDYLPETYSICQGNLNLETQDVIWYENPSMREQTLDYFIKVDQSFKVYEYTLKYRVQASVLDEQQEIASQQANNPITMELKGVSHQFVDERDEYDARYALLDCLRDDYMFPESIGSAGSIYLVSEVTLPDWAREYALENGLLVTWYHYKDDIGCGVGVSLPNFPENLGHQEVNLHNLVLDTLVYVDDPDAVGILVDYPASPLSIWKQDSDGDLELVKLAQISTENVKIDAERKSYSYLLDGEVCAALPEDGEFYLVLGTEMTHYVTSAPIE